MRKVLRLLKLSSLVASILVLPACLGGGGGSSAPAASTLNGVAAVGTPIVNGTINVICAAGSALTSTTTSSTGTWQVTLSDQTLPCAVKVSGGTINGSTNPTPYHSLAITAGTVNVTPLTDLMVSNIVGTATPSIWFAGLSTTPTPLSAITQDQVTAALTKLSAALSGLSPLSTNNPITTTFAPTSGNVSDDMLTALATAMVNTGVAHSSLLANASAVGFTAPTANFGTALATAFKGTPSGGGSTTPVYALSLSPSSLTFTSQNVGTSSAAQTASLSNTGSGVLNISSIVATGDFAKNTTCGTTLAAGASCTISVTFTPTASGGRSGVVTITSNAANGSATLNLSGTGTGGSTPIVSATCSQSNFTLANYNAIAIGMTLQQVNQTMGCQYYPSMTTHVQSLTVYNWYDGGQRLIMVWFDSNGTVTSSQGPDGFKQGTF